VTAPLHLLDTNVVLALVRGNALGHRIDAQFGLRAARNRPLLCVVSIGELRVLAREHRWGSAKLSALQEAIDNLVVVDISVPVVLDAYVELDVASQRHPDGARNMGKNDLWIAACARAAKAILLTTDKDFGHLIPTWLAGEIIAVE
jgi:tRNA(fMet)-specific endonuclease VapC